MTYNLQLKPFIFFVVEMGSDTPHKNKNKSDLHWKMS